MAKLDQEARAIAENKRILALTMEIKQDFENRRENRRQLEDGWLLNMRFLSGDQYCDVAPYGGLMEEEKRFYWQTRRVYNRIAPIIDARMSKLVALRPTLAVKAFSDEEGDVQAAKLASAVLKYAQDNIDFPRVASRVTLWAEACGSAFYKIVWNEKGGRQVSVDENNLPVCFLGAPCKPFIASRKRKLSVTIAGIQCHVQINFAHCKSTITDTDKNKAKSKFTF